MQKIIPIVRAEVREVSHWRPSKGARFSLRVHCPYCGKTHIHGAGSILLNVPRMAGYRTADCGGGAYFLVMRERAV